MTRLHTMLVLFALLGALLTARLFQVQVLEHPLWAQEAARLVRKGREQPYQRGRILDAQMNVLARDEGQRSVVLVYRDFRRDHPLGQVAHARSLTEGRPVSLAEAGAHLFEWARDLCLLRPAELRAFARGELGPPETRALDARTRARRASDLLFYVRRLLDLHGKAALGEWKALQGLAEEEGETRSFLALAAAVRQGPGPAGLAVEEHALEQRLARSLERLGVLARWLRPDFEGDVLGAFVAELEEERRHVEDLAAAKLFAEAVGFAPGRIESDTLLACFDHGWIAALLGWDGPRLAQWAAEVRHGWLASWRDEVCLPRLFWALVQDPSLTPSAADFLARLAVVYQPEDALLGALEHGPTPWREVADLAVFARLAEQFEAEVPDSALALGRAALPIQLAELRADPDDLRLLPAGEGAGSFRDLLARSFEGRGRAEVTTLLELSARLLEVWELRYQETLRAALDQTRRAAARDELGPEGGLILAASSRERAAERAEYFLKDYGSRQRPLSKGELSYDVVYLLTRYESDFPGFLVDEYATRARVELAGDDHLPAERLLGVVSAPTLEDQLRQWRRAARLRELKGRPSRAEAEELELVRLIGEVRLPAEVKGVEGLEAFFEPELTGTNGFYVTPGLAELFGAHGEEISVRDPVDGRDLVLTLRAGLQAAAQRSLREPDPAHADYVWRTAPVGAIVLLAPSGDVLAAASEPDDQSQIDPASKGERLVRAERTLTKRTFQPPGSSFKVFVAAWALEHGLDPLRTVTCGPIERGGAGYKDLRCWNNAGHGPVDLRAALERSCNAYFAWLGETLTTRDFEGLCAAFGFGEPTGVRRAPPGDEGLRRREGLREDLAGLAVPAGASGLSDPLRRMAANGLGKIEATPMQVARGMLALARGEKRELRLVQKIGAQELPRAAGVPLGIGTRSLEFVRAAMRGVAEDARGTAHNALAPAELGFSVAVKTGSADLQSRRDEEGHVKVQKHAWVAGWVPAENPRLVFVVFEHDTSETSSHGAVYLARQLLRQPEVLAYLADEGVDISRVPAR